MVVDTKYAPSLWHQLHPCAGGGNRISLTDLKRRAIYQIFPRKQYYRGKKENTALFEDSFTEPTWTIG
jgi:hypothetical protein